MSSVFFMTCIEASSPDAIMLRNEDFGSDEG